ncbi:hypothetical protein P799_07405 [Lysinibacillus sphaericus CBAM5]|uniref:Uncharacterized protein n=3 Tax=Lysinibacillus TaxID=400634 RepID=B1HWW3_LYSSC|nr:hypothetical protein Bsph_2395 [Lysinibacillus sphaericus C3-41]EWH34003.1 hypothetical protein P799_07405 [Lysinibacillus sphaericus CBAM5]
MRMTKVYVMTMTKGNDEQDYEQWVNEKIFEKKSDLKEYLNKEGYLKKSTYQYMKIEAESIVVADIQKIKLK